AVADVEALTDIGQTWHEVRPHRSVPEEQEADPPASLAEARCVDLGGHAHSLMVKGATRRSSSRDEGPTSISNSPGSTTRRPSAGTMVHDAAGTSMPTRAGSPGTRRTWVKALSSRSAHVAEVLTSRM